MTQKAKILEAHQRSYDVAINVKQGDVVTWMKHDLWDDSHTWVWCVASDGKEGWIALDCLDIDNESATLKRDFNAIELSVNGGEVITVYEELAGWCWSENVRGDTGWIPRSKIEYVSA